MFRGKREDGDAVMNGRDDVTLCTIIPDDKSMMMGSDLATALAWRKWTGHDPKGSDWDHGFIK